MSIGAEGWFIRAGDGPATLVREALTVEAPTGTEVLVRPLYGSWEGNMGHALDRKPIDVCRFRNEERVLLGNSGVVEVLEVGDAVQAVRPGDKAIIFCNGEEDHYGYPKRIWGYDAVSSMGLLATRVKLQQRQLIPIRDSRHDLKRWAAFSLRYITAWSNWEVAHGTYRLQVHEDEHAAIHVWGWGGGTTLAELDLARRFGCRAVGLSGNPARLETIRRTGVTALDRNAFGPLSFDPERFKNDPAWAAEFRRAEQQFLEEVRERTQGRMVQIFIDLVGSPVFRTTLKALARQGVVTTCGWKEGMQLSLVRATECIERHQHVHTHYARYQQGWKAVAFAEANGWLPQVDDRIYTFDEVPQLAADYAAGKVGTFPIYSVDP